MKTKIIYTYGLIALLILAGKTSGAQEVENEYQSRTEIKLSYKPLKKLKLSFTPEFRFDENFSLDKYLFEGGLEYKPLNFLELEATYRYVINPRDNKDTQYFNRFALSATAKKEFNRFEPAFRLRYSNDADDDITDKEFLRYKASLDYDIPNFKLTPFIAAEAFQQLDWGGLYKLRYSTGFDYKLFKKNYIGLSYKFDYYQNEYRNRHIISLGYKIKF